MNSRDGQQIECRFSPDGEPRPSEAVVEGVAQAKDVGPLELTPLYGTIDPDALDALFGNGRVGHLEFEYEGYDVTVHADGWVVVGRDGAA